jgi:malonyl-CoA O-methyltransferase
MRSIKDKIRDSFSKAALTYDQESDVQNRISDQLIDLMNEKTFQSVFELGSGTGSYSEKLIRKYPEAEFVLCDFSRTMIEISKTKLSKFNHQITYNNSDIEELKPDEFSKGSFDLITSSSTLQWITDYKNVLNRIYDFLSERGTFLFSFFGPDTYRELNGIIEENYPRITQSIPASGFSRINELKSIMENKFNKVDIREYHIQQDYHSLLELLKKIKNCGEYGYGLQNQIQIMPKELNKMETLYINKYKKIVATYHYYIILAEK